MKKIVVLGSTGSIGIQTLDVARLHNIKILALSANKSAKLLEQQAREFLPEYVCIGDESLYPAMKERLSDTGIKVLCGIEGLCEIASLKCDRVLNAVVGMVGLRPTLAAIEAGNDVALANKETLVTGGRLVTSAARRKNVKIYPVDSEHSAIFQCLMGNANNAMERIILTASGGPFFGYTPAQLKTVIKEQALSHPNWSMGKKITVDSATLINKGLEFIEAMWLFDAAPMQIDVVVHRQSIVHSAVEFVDGAIIAQMGAADMRIPIQLALTYPYRFVSPAKHLSAFELGTLTFERPDEDTFYCLKLAREAALLGGNAATILNSANEAAVGLFLNDKIPFYRIPELVRGATESVEFKLQLDLQTILDTEAAAREYVLSNA